ncbi:lecithin:cholesterol acyltransferase [Longilinea arvoryzae]|uniref:Lecithin:cholesterol acyltransferase n=1 Tax=Longilinea arvoryzae TaxID=360412 RepID=A0A0S7BFG6_9CHLR|nr:alpha/beta fold hydrolase [Longilinea arvoryzae]GAP13716.1 lecithin:cholesterol acyltransferase [Longilinea arvoryzae]
MDTNDLLHRWSTLSLAEIEEQIVRGEDQETVTQLLGADTVAEIQNISFAPPPAGPRDEVVLIPGIMGSTLASIRGVTTLIWVNPLLFLQGNGRFLRLNSNGDNDEASEVEVVPIGLEKLAYLKTGLQFNRQTNLHEFPYDWRRPIETNADILRNSIDHWAGGVAQRKFNLVAHSMGGLVARSYLARYPRHAELHVARLIMLGTPNFGAANAVDNLINGNSMMATVDKLNAQNEMRKLVFCLPSVYQLLPAPPEFFPDGRSYPVNFDLYRAAEWRIDEIQQKYLDAARGLHKALAGSEPQIPIHVIAGANIDTLVAVELQFNNDVPRLQPLRQASGPDSGDGTVPLWSAVLPGATTYYTQVIHRELPGTNSVIRAALDLIRTGACDLPETLPAPRPFPFEVTPPASPELQAEALRGKIEDGTAGDSDLQKMFFAF